MNFELIGELHVDKIHLNKAIKTDKFENSDNGDLN